MKTHILEKPFCLNSKEIEKPSDILPHEALLRIRNIGICGTDYHAFKGHQPFFTYPRVLGHEIGAEVVSIGLNEKGLKIGDKVAVEPYFNCEKCQPCLLGKSNCCENLQVLGVHIDGGMAEYLKVPLNKLHPSNILNFEQLAMVEPLSIGSHAVERALVTEKDLVLVIGAGPIGLGVMLFAKLKGATVLVLDTNIERLNFAKKQLNVDFTFEAKKDFSPNILKEKLNGLLPSVVFDATGNQASMNAAINFVSFGGKLAFVGLFIGDVSFHDPLFHRREITLLASRNSLPEDFTKIITLMEAGSIDVSKFITHRAEFDDFPFKFNEWLDPKSKVVKAMLAI